MLVVTLDRDVAGHLAVALRRHRDALKKEGIAEPPGIAELESAALQVVNSTHDDSPGITVEDALDDGLHDRIYLTRRDVQRLSGASRATVDRWLGSGQLRSSKHGRIRRIARRDLDRFLSAA
jgi:excisionase family DNA binding protein